MSIHFDNLKPKQIYEIKNKPAEIEEQSIEQVPQDTPEIPAPNDSEDKGISWLAVNHKKLYEINSMVINTKKIVSEQESEPVIVDDTPVLADDINPFDVDDIHFINSIDDTKDAGPWSQFDLKYKYHLTDEDINIFFKTVKYDNSDPLEANIYEFEINKDNAQKFLGKEVNNIHELLEALKGELSIDCVYGRYNLAPSNQDSEKYLQYLIQTGENGSNNITFRLDFAKIEQDFPGQGIITIGQLKEAVDTKGLEKISYSALKETHHLTDEDIKILFKQVGDNYVINQDVVKIHFGKEITTVQELMEAMKGELSMSLVYGAYNIMNNADNEKYFQYLIQTGENGSNNITFRLDFAKIEQDFPGQEITTLGQLKEAVDSVEKRAAAVEEQTETATEEDCKSEIASYKEALINALKTAGDQGYGDGSYVLLQNDINKYLYWDNIENIDIPRLINSYIEGGGKKGGFADYLKTKMSGIIGDRLKNLDCSKWLLNETVDGLKGSVIKDLRAGKYADGYKFIDKDADDVYSAACEQVKPSQMIWDLIAEGKSVEEIKEAVRKAVEDAVKTIAAETAAKKADEGASPSENAAKALSALKQNDSSDNWALRVSSTINAIEQQYAADHNSYTKINTAFSISSDGSIQFKNSFVKTMFDGLFNRIKSVVGSDGFDEGTLKQLYQTAWEMVYSGVSSNQENDISEFLTKVYDNFKAILSRIKDKPEYLDILTGKTANGDKRVVNDAFLSSSGGGSVDCSGGLVYDDGTVHVRDDQSDLNLQKAVNTILGKLKAAYPDIPETTLKSLLNEAVNKAVYNIAMGKADEIPNNFAINGSRIYANTIANLALVYFEQALYNRALSDYNLLAGNSKDETPTTNRASEELGSIKEKYEKASEKINDMLKDLFDTYYINSILTTNGCDGNHSLKMDVDSSGNIKFFDQKTKIAYDKLFEAIIGKSAFKNSGLTETEFKQVYNIAWLNVYNSYNNTDSPNLSDVLNKVVKNIQNILNKVKTEPNYLSIVENGSAMKQVTANDTNINYGNTDVNSDYGDGNVHLSDDESDKNYQKAVNELKAKLKGIYVPPLSESQFNTWFLQAQKNAINTCINNETDVTNNAVFNKTKALINSDYNSRKGDGSNITLGQLMELIAYKFDKLVNKNIFG